MSYVRSNALIAVAALALFAVGPGAAAPREQAMGVFTDHTDVGSPRKAGSVVYDAKRDVYTVSGSGTNMWTDHDEFQFVWRRMTGDFIVQTRAAFEGKGVEAHRKLGLIARASLDPNSAYADAAVHGDGLTSLQFRRTAGAQTEENKSQVSGADVLRLERKGDTVTMSVARFGDTFQTESVTGVALGDDVYVGLFVCAHNPDVVERATFRDVRIVVPARDSLVPYRDYIGSHVELLDVDTGHREIVTSAPDSIQAPNWTPDGRALIYNHNGRLYRFDLRARRATPIDTGLATNNNNDHVLSFDGKMLAISNNGKEDNGNSIGYVVPVGGGTPKRVTATGPSYMHGWSPDGKWLVFTGQRNGEFDIYRISPEGGPETRLTTATGLDDGPEYTPDGRYIYFNSVRSGLMQIWRMKPDGSDQEQVTNDELNNWFPHISPDGTRIVFISFGQDVAPNDHPFYKRVYIRSMPAAGGAPKVVAYLYGGQGTINVPSWSPDSKRVAFVSNSDKY